MGEREIDKTHKLKILQVSWNLAGWGPSNRVEVQNIVEKLDKMIDDQDIIVFNFQEVVEMKMGAYAMGNAIAHSLKPILKNKIRNVKNYFFKVFSFRGGSASSRAMTSLPIPTSWSTSVTCLVLEA